MVDGVVHASCVEESTVATLELVEAASLKMQCVTSEVWKPSPCTMISALEPAGMLLGETEARKSVLASRLHRKPLSTSN
eukprot:412274-Rhodomonas_salina.2